MNKNSTKVVGLVLIIAVLLVAIGYAAITSVTLNINGTANATTNKDNFVVRFTGTPEVSDADKVTATLSETDQLKATMNVERLTAKGDIVTATYTIENASPDLSAALTAVTSNTNTEYFDVSYDIAKGTIAHGETTTITVTVELKKTPIKDNVSSDIGVIITAEPQQPTV